MCIYLPLLDFYFASLKELTAISVQFRHYTGSMQFKPSVFPSLRLLQAPILIQSQDWTGLFVNELGNSVLEGILVCQDCHKKIPQAG